MTEKTMSAFEVLANVDVSDRTDTKGKFTYLSWSIAVLELSRRFPRAEWDTRHFIVDGREQPFMQTPAGCFVETWVTVDGVTRRQIHPVLDERNKTILEPSAFDINRSIQRCLTKNIALHGLGLGVFAGEDISDDGDPQTSTHRAPAASRAVTPSAETQPVLRTEDQGARIHALSKRLGLDGAALDDVIAEALGRARALDEKLTKVIAAKVIYLLEKRIENTTDRKGAA